APASEPDDLPEITAPGAGKTSRMPLLLALTALLLAVLGLAGVAWQSLATRDPDELASRNGAALERLSEQLRDSKERLEGSEQALAALRSSIAEGDNSLSSLTRTLNDRLRPLEAVPGRLSNIESSMSALQGISSGLRDTWLLSEAEYYLQIANAQLQLASNVSLAQIALKLADERLVSLGNPALTDIRRALADELRQLDALGEADTEGAALTLSSLAGAVESLPLKTDITQTSRPDPAIDQELSGMARAWASVRSSLSNVISVRRSDQPVKPLLPPDAAYFLRSNLTLQLQAARLALLRGEQTLFRQSLDDAANWIGEYYDAHSMPVRSALDTIRELRLTEFRPAPPDISGSLALLRQFMSLHSRNQLPEPEAADDNGSNQ
ncbi:MAG: uroporphyrinogen-III C-methyltransferase, partial [Halioglobus sp.]|nr:uroporphyrinogen-III C-methyltransferase [Halioglobus sp.]